LRKKAAPCGGDGVHINKPDSWRDVGLVYAGPPGAGKTTTMQRVQAGLASPWNARVTRVDDGTGPQVLLTCEPHPPVFRDRARVRFRAGLKILLRDAEGVCFVADAAAGVEENARCLAELDEDLREAGRAGTPRILQINKRDAAGAMAAVDLRRHLDWRGAVFETVATRGEGVVEAFRALVDAVLGAGGSP
jgi:hypothetical protein